MKHTKYGIWLVLGAVLGCGPVAAVENAAAPPITPGRILKTTGVIYPLLDRRFSHEGQVIVMLELDDKGKALSAVVAEPSDWQGLDDSAVKTALQWEYSPATTAEGQPVASSKPVAVTFKLKARTPEELAGIEGDILGKIGYVLGSYYTYRKTADQYLDACGKRGFDVAKAQTQLRDANGAIEPGIGRIEQYMNDNDAFLLNRIQAYYRDGDAYGKLVRMDELREGPAEKAKARCTRLLANFEAGRETLQHFDPYAYQLFGEIQLENPLPQ